jgi:hypothetical protein
MGRIRPMASVLQVWRPAEVSPCGRSRGRPAHAVGAEVQARQSLRGKHHGEEGQPLDKEARRGLTRNHGAPVERWGGAALWHLTAVEGSRWSPMRRP